jgi:hypothetical protein
MNVTALKKEATSSSKSRRIYTKLHTMTSQNRGIAPPPKKRISFFKKCEISYPDIAACTKTATVYQLMSVVLKQNTFCKNKQVQNNLNVNKVRLLLSMSIPSCLLAMDFVYTGR